MAVFLVVWALAAAWKRTPRCCLALAAIDAFVELAIDGELFMHAAISFGRMLASLALARWSRSARPRAGLSRRTRAIVDPTVELLRPISGIAWIPLALFIFGIGNALPVFIMTYAAFFPILLGTVAGVRGVDRRLIDAARTMGVPRARSSRASSCPRRCRRCSCAAARRRARVDRGRRRRADRRAERPGLRGRVVSRAPDDAAGDGVHRDDRRARLPVRRARARAVAPARRRGRRVGRAR
jgi:hypothetical protein